MADTGNQGTITFATSGFTANFRVIGSVEQTRPKLSVSHLGSTDFDEYCPGDLVDPGELEVEYEFDDTAALPDILEQVPELITVTLPTQPGNTSGATFVDKGFILKRSTPELKNNQLQTGKMTIAFAGTDQAWTPGA